MNDSTVAVPDDSAPPAFRLREFRSPDDYVDAAWVLTAASPEWPVTPELLQTWDEAEDPNLFRTDVVAEQGGRVVGVGRVGHDDFAFEEWRYWGNLTVHPEARGQGVGGAMYRELLGRVQAREAREIRTMLSDGPHHEAGRALLAAHGWQETWQRYESRIQTAETDLSRFGPLMDGVAAHGIELHSVASLAADPERNRKLWELDWLLFQDVPMGTALTKRPFEAWVAQELEDPTFSADLSFVAVRPDLNDPLTGSYVGYSTLMQNPSGFYVIGMTGVRREDRGKGVAKALKVAAMQALNARGGGEIRTFNDAPNAAMLGMNQALGFVRGPTHLRYELHLAEAEQAEGGQ
ncbi:GNAT family N-acetyltransferase [Deinococcus puniceus]|uniref:GCN5 family acetyltransferase n=1 Tax=Deinococcus puniceus TaxID=1182568 RepID=A0A172TBV2_9DEIO|nr:GNAT family N-acetyltransferase [Deinococcus puniceus]ANE44535.1 GCN5 family acetyltransferase [Deinococcus puniceus]